MYSQSNIDVYGTKVKYIDVVFHPVCAPPAECIVPLSETVTYKMDLEGCMIVGDMCIPFPGEMHKTFNDGRFIDLGSDQGAMFIPRSSEPLNPINELLKIQWCPDQNYFLVKLAGQLLEPLRHQATVFSTVSPLADASGPVQGSSCMVGNIGACGSSTYPTSGLECKCAFSGILPVGPVCTGTIGTCEPKISPYLNQKCDLHVLGACGSTANPESGLICVSHCFEFNVGPPTCRAKNPVENAQCCPGQTCAGGLECRNTGEVGYSTCQKPK